MRRNFYPVLSVLFLIGFSLYGRASHGQIGVIAALPEELTALRAGLENVHEEKKGNSAFVTGKMGSLAVALTLSGIGKVNAAMAAQRLISDYHVKAIVVTGVAGGISKAVQVGDIVIGAAVYQHDFGYLGDKFILHAVGTAPEFGIGTGKEPRNMTATWPRSKNNRDFLASVFEIFNSERESLSTVSVDDKEYRPVVRKGVIATGDQFIANEAKKKELAEQGADVVEMEGASVAQVAIQNGIPFLIVRSVSDKAGQRAKIDFSKFFPTVAGNNAALVKRLLLDAATGAYLNSL